MKPTRKCADCKKEFNIFENDFIKENGKYYEIDCYKNKLIKKGLSKEDVNKILSDLISINRIEKEKLIKKQKDIINKQIASKKREINRKDNLNNLINYFKEVYDVSVFPSYFYSKLAEINRGTFKGVSLGIPYEDLLDMFKRKQKDLNRIATNNYNKGKEITGLKRINYDIAILISKYDNYLSWKNKKKLLEVENKIDNEEKIKINYSKLSNNINKNKEEIDISDILDDIY